MKTLQTIKNARDYFEEQSGLSLEEINICEIYRGSSTPLSEVTLKIVDHTKLMHLIYGQWSSYSNTIGIIDNMPKELFLGVLAHELAHAAQGKLLKKLFPLQYDHYKFQSLFYYEVDAQLSLAKTMILLNKNYYGFVKETDKLKAKIKYYKYKRIYSPLNKSCCYLEKNTKYTLKKLREEYIKKEKNRQIDFERSLNVDKACFSVVQMYPDLPKILQMKKVYEVLHCLWYMGLDCYKPDFINPDKCIPFDWTASDGSSLKWHS